MSRSSNLGLDAIAITLISNSGSPVYIFLCIRLRYGKAHRLYDCKRFTSTPDAAAWLASHGDIPDIHVYFEPGQVPFRRQTRGHRYPRQQKGQE